MQKICIWIIAALCVIIFLINISAWGLYPPTEWNFNYTATYEKYVVKLLLDSPNDSELRKLCEEELECKKLLEQYKFNGTIRAF